MKINEIKVQTFNRVDRSGKITPGNELTLEQLFENVKHNPFKKRIQFTRRYLKKNSNEVIEGKGRKPVCIGSLYNKIKQSLPAFMPNANCYRRRNINNINSTTNVIYVDLDFGTEKESQNYKTELIRNHGKNIIAIYKSYGGAGLSVLVYTKKVTAFNFKNSYQYICSLLNLPYDDKSCDLVRLNVISADHDIFINWEAEPIDCSLVNFDSEVHTVKNLSSNRNIRTRQFYYHPVIDIHYQHYLDNPESSHIINQGNGVYFTPVGLPNFSLWSRKNKIKTKHRNFTLYRDMMIYVLLNMFKSEQEYYIWLSKRNSMFSEIPLEEKEINRIVEKVLLAKQEGQLYMNTMKVKHTWFAHNCKLFPDERKKIASQNRKLISLFKVNQAIQLLKKDKKEISLLNLIAYTGLHRNTVKACLLIKNKERDSNTQNHLCNVQEVDYKSFSLSVSFSEIESKINLLISKGEIIIQQKVAELLNCSLKTVQRKWNIELKQKVKKHNIKMKEENKALKAGQSQIESVVPPVRKNSSHIRIYARKNAIFTIKSNINEPTQEPVPFHLHWRTTKANSYVINTNEQAPENKLSLLFIP